jgi:hypothetical protein
MRPVSSRVKSQVPTTSKVVFTQGFRSRTIAFNTTSSLRIQATNATFFAFLTLKPAPNGLGSLPSRNQPVVHDLQRRVMPNSRLHRHEQHCSHIATTTTNKSLSAMRTTVLDPRLNTRSLRLSSQRIHVPNFKHEPQRRPHPDRS